MYESITKNITRTKTIHVRLFKYLLKRKLSIEHVHIVLRVTHDNQPCDIEKKRISISNIKTGI